MKQCLWSNFSSNSQRKRRLLSRGYVTAGNLWDASLRHFSLWLGNFQIVFLLLLPALSFALQGSFVPFQPNWLLWQHYNTCQFSKPEEQWTSKVLTAWASLQSRAGSPFVTPVGRCSERWQKGHGFVQFGFFFQKITSNLQNSTKMIEKLFKVIGFPQHDIFAILLALNQALSHLPVLNPVLSSSIKPQH